VQLGGKLAQLGAVLGMRAAEFVQDPP